MTTQIETPTEVEATPQTKEGDPDFQKFMKALTTPSEEEKTPDNYAVILHNDPQTPGHQVAIILQEVFTMPRQRAWDIMMAAHDNGSATVAVMTEKEADDKIAKALEMARGYPLRFSKEKEQ